MTLQLDERVRGLRAADPYLSVQAAVRMATKEELVQRIFCARRTNSVPQLCDVVELIMEGLYGK